MRAGTQSIDLTTGQIGEIGQIGQIGEIGETDGFGG